MSGAEKVAFGRGATQIGLADVSRSITLHGAARDFGTLVRSWQRTQGRALATGATATGVTTNDAPALVLLDDMELLFEAVDALGVGLDVAAAA